MLDRERVRTIAQRYSNEVRKVLNPTSIILFGSYVNGNPNALCGAQGVRSQESEVRIWTGVRGFRVFY